MFTRINCALHIHTLVSGNQVVMMYIALQMLFRCWKFFNQIAIRRKIETQYEFIYNFQVKSFLLVSSLEFGSHKLEAFCLDIPHQPLAACLIKFITLYCCVLHFVRIRLKHKTIETNERNGRKINENILPVRESAIDFVVCIQFKPFALLLSTEFLLWKSRLQ